jgi:AraC-like DNA-binding protein
MDTTVQALANREAVQGPLNQFTTRKGYVGGQAARPQRLAHFHEAGEGATKDVNILLMSTSAIAPAPDLDAMICPPDRYVFTIAVKDDKFASCDTSDAVAQRTIFAFTLSVAGPGRKVPTPSSRDCDLIHLSVKTAFLERQQAFAHLASLFERQKRDLDQLIVNAPLIAQIGRFLGGRPKVWSAAHAETLELIVARLVELLPRRGRQTALLPWRLRKVKDLIESDVAAPLRLEDLAAAAGLSRMHFAAQFRLATGYRPHEYVLTRRIEHAKALIEENELSLVEVALDAGFQSQAHFCTIFKRMTGTTPSSWRQYRQSPDHLPTALCSRSKAEFRIDPPYDRQPQPAWVSTSLALMPATPAMHDG